jgi:SAM-dependent methyltransferase
MRRIVFFKPATFVVEDRLAGGKRSIDVFPAGGSEPVAWKAMEKEGAKLITISAGDRRCDLIFPSGPGEGTIAVTEGKNKLLPKRPLPAGILPHGPEGVEMIRRWDSRYRGRDRAPWDTGHPNRWLVEMIEAGTIKPCRSVVLGCGSGTNSIYLATRGFDVTALDIAPTALAMAQEKADRAGVKVRWLLSDVLAPPALEPFDFLFDSGCYHGVRRGNAAGYVKTANSLAKAGALMLILAGNANEPRRYGPPRVEETDLVGDFAATWDIVNLRELRPGANPGRASSAWFWSALMRRRPR